ncbi:MAG: hypothetical protein HC882_08660 [Acidobacteria bacterium]|nr:hypothetical protein [Acidobacteriota bacterium]
MRPGTSDRPGGLQESSRPRAEGGPQSGPAPRKPIPPSRTHAEEFYYLKQIQSGTPMVVVLEDGERLHGRLEWYDESTIKLHRSDGPNLLIFKRHVLYMHKDDEAAPRP